MVHGHARFPRTHVFATPGVWRLVPTGANGAPAAATYLRDADGTHRAHAVQVLSVVGDRISGIVAFQDARLFPVFNLPIETEVVERLRPGIKLCREKGDSCSAAGRWPGRCRVHAAMMHESSTVSFARTTLPSGSMLAELFESWWVERQR